MKTPDPMFSLPVATARFEAWWERGRLDRPPVTLQVQSRRKHRALRGDHATLRERWLDAGFQVEAALARLEATHSLGDTVPSFVPGVGPDLLAALFGAGLEFGETSAWCLPSIAGPGDWERFLGTAPDFSHEGWKALEAMIEGAAARFAGRFVIGMPDLHGNFDILAGLRGAEDLCLDVADEPDLLRRAARHASRGFREAMRRLYGRLSALGQPGTTWCPYLHDGRAYAPGCGFWRLVSGETADELIAPAIEFEMAPLERSIFHLEGPAALQHLDRVLALPRLDAVLWDYGHGRAMDWVRVYRRAREAGKSVQVMAADGADALEILLTLGPDGVWIQVSEPFPNVDRAKEFLEAVHRLCR
jgi:hypothetical protein